MSKKQRGLTHFSCLSVKPPAVPWEFAGGRGWLATWPLFSAALFAGQRYGVGELLTSQL